ncbi:DNA-3-methyladenine glycosylase [Paraburkholderia sp.]|uniref:DNA-3-methyladenine glycosylase n=1 Tax=Paraburkholderia sp. TaxID=1926495 RepID=UPI00238B5390|nr:DNA-3-methyladenine glycosylase [Paraburkholderia sp.]MDE1182558.1 DNA-3-methyladenine glycosylase [Paraburkholderia sp.]
MVLRPLVRDRLPVDTVEMARFLIGRYVVHDLPEGRTGGRIVETEAYPVGDSTSHAFHGRRKYNGALFLAPGHAYVRLTYGACFVLNVSSEPAGTGAGVLIRAIEPFEGDALERMKARRPGASLRDLTRGPGRLAAALGIDLSFDSVDLCTGEGLWLGERAVPGASDASDASDASADHRTGEIGVTTRIGLTRETERLLRFYARGSVYISGPQRLLAK